MTPKVQESCEDAARLVAAITPAAELGAVSRHMVLMGAGGGAPYAPRVIASGDATGIAEHVRAAWTANGRANAYFTPNPVRLGWTGTKPTKADIAGITAVMIDLDSPAASRPGPEDGAGWEALRARMLALGEQVAQLPTNVRPTAIVFSGNGLQLHYRLTWPLNAGGAVVAEALEAQWRDEVLRPLGADKTQNRDRLARLPGPNIKYGRPDGCAVLIDADPSRTYGLEDFPRIRDALLELPRWPTAAAGERQTRADRRADPQVAADDPIIATENGAGAQNAGARTEGARIEAGIKELLPILGELRGKDRTTLSPAAGNMMLGSRTVLRRLDGDVSDLPDGSNSAVFQSLAGAVKAKGGTMEVFAELAFACDLSRAHLEKQPDDRMMARAVARAWVRAPEPEQASPGSGRAAALDDNTLAREFALRHDGKFLYDHSRGRWLAWIGDCWAQDEKGQHIEACRRLAEELARAAISQRPAISHSRIKGALALAATDPKVAATKDDFDRDHYLLGVPGATIELRTGQARAPDPADRISRQTAVAPAEAAHCPNWLAFLADATGGDQDMIQFLQCWFGYNLTGDTKEQKFVMAHGPGGTGKGTAVDTIYHLMGGYAEVVEMDALLASNGQRHPTDLAGLVGARMVTAAETERGRPWNEARIKRLTGGDPIPARFMRQDFFTFTPEFKLTVTGNHAPLVDATDDALRRRLIVVPFTRKPKQADHGLREKLKSEWPAILRWMIEGALKWQRLGLKPPAAADRATDDVFGEGDLLGRFLADECETAPGNDGLWCSTARLYSEYSEYARAAGESPGTQREFTDSLKKRGFENTRKNQGRGWSGIQLREHEPTETADDPGGEADAARHFAKAPVLQ